MSTLPVTTSELSGVQRAGHCHCSQGSSPTFDEHDASSLSLHDDNDFVGLSDDDDLETTFYSPVENMKFIEISSDQAEADTDSCNMSLLSNLSSEDVANDSETLAGSLMVEFDSDASDEEYDTADERISTPMYINPVFAPLPQTTPWHHGFVQAPQPLLPQVSLRKLQTQQPVVQQRQPVFRQALASTIETVELVALGLVPSATSSQPPIYPTNLPFVRCCYDANEKKGCDKGRKCYHLHKDASHRVSSSSASSQGRHHEIHVDRPHFVSFDTLEHGVEHSPSIQSLPCHYGMLCKNSHHRESAIKHKFNAAAMTQYETYLRSYRSYEFELIKYQLSVNKARRVLTDEMVLDAFATHGGNADISSTTRAHLASLRPW